MASMDGNSSMAEPDPDDDQTRTWVVAGCPSAAHFWQQCQQADDLEHLAPLSAATSDGVVLRGFDNLLQWLDWMEALERARAGRRKNGS